MWSFGITVYQTITGNLPFEADNAAEYLLKVANPEEEIPELPTDVPQFWRDIVKRMLNRNPTERPTAREVCLLLGRVPSFKSKTAEEKEEASINWTYRSEDMPEWYHNLANGDEMA